MDNVVGMRFEVGAEGVLEVLDVMGDERAIADAARVSYGKGTKRISDDVKLLRYLWRHGHTSPFEMCEMKFFVRVPMDVWRQWVRHRTASVNEYSTRYSEVKTDFDFAGRGGWRRQSSSNRQGSEGWVDAAAAEELTALEADLYGRATALYERALSAGVAREQARRVLPLATYTEAYWKSDLRNILHFLSLRLSPSAQKEIREYAWAMAEAVRAWVPNVWSAFEDYTLHSVRLSRTEAELVRLFFGGMWEEATAWLSSMGWLDTEEMRWTNEREARECVEKLKKLTGTSFFAE